MIEMHSAEESKLFFLAVVAYVLLSSLLTTFIVAVMELKQAKSQKHTHQEQKADEMQVTVSNDEYYEIAQQAIAHRKMLEFKCEMNGFDKAIRILKGEE